MSLFFILMLSLLILINIYDGFKIKKCFGMKKNLYFLTALPVHIVLFCIFATMFFMRGSENTGELKNILTIIGFGFVTASFYMFLMFIFCGVFRFILNKAGLVGGIRKILSAVYAKGITVVVLSFLFIVYGVINASDIVITEYNIDIPNGRGNVDGLNIVMFSDTHMGTTINEKEVDEIVEKVNNINPDIIFLCGDIFDEGTSDGLKEYASNAFKNFKSKYGAFYITGNHEYYSGISNGMIDCIKDAGITVLSNEYYLVDNRFYVVGRPDQMILKEEGGERKELSEVLEDVDKEIPIIVLDHRPVGTKEAKDNGVDLQLSGHTHSGQIFPINFLSALSNDVNYGYVKDDNYNIIVTSGCGTWGVPIRIGSSTEIVNIKVN